MSKPERLNSEGWSVYHLPGRRGVDGVDGRRFSRQSTAVDGGRPPRGAGHVYPGRLGRQARRKSGRCDASCCVGPRDGRVAGLWACACRMRRRVTSASRCFVVLFKTSESFLTYNTDTVAESRHAHSLRLSRPLAHTHTPYFPTSRQSRDPTLLFSRLAPCSGASPRRASHWCSLR